MHTITGERVATMVGQNGGILKAHYMAFRGKFDLGVKTGIRPMKNKNVSSNPRALHLATNFSHSFFLMMCIKKSFKLKRNTQIKGGGKKLENGFST